MKNLNELAVVNAEANVDDGYLEQVEIDNNGFNEDLSYDCNAWEEDEDGEKWVMCRICL